MLFNRLQAISSIKLTIGAMLLGYTGQAQGGTPYIPTQASAQVRCGDCHAQQVSAWASSQHARAMAVASSTTVRGNFADTHAQQWGLNASFREANGNFYMGLERKSRSGRGAVNQQHHVGYTFGDYPLQQYLTDVGDGKLQVLPFAWDARPAGAGGQRWITQYPNEDIRPADRLHYLQPLQNWNGMCGDCHSTGFRRGYNPAQQKFNSSLTTLNVSCDSCHSLGDKHGVKQVSEDKAEDTLPDMAAAASGSSMDTCFGCHALRTPLTDGIDPRLAFLDQFTPALIEAPLYFADGQIREEVFVYGSFTQSSKHGAGVTCGNCHDPHTSQLRVPGNALCSGCHIANRYDTQAHHHHADDSSGAQCVNCHMPARTYMVVDPRRDHSFGIPNPSLHTDFGVPDACSGCHEHRDSAWASDALSSWGMPSQQPTAAETLFMRSQAGQVLRATEFSALLADKNLPVILRASALRQQFRLAPDERFTGPTAGPSTELVDAFNDQEPLLQLAAAQSITHLPPPQKPQLLTPLLQPLLQNRYRVIRVAAAQAFDSLHKQTPPNKSTESTESFQDALAVAQAESAVAVTNTAWRGEGRLNTALAHQRQGALALAIADYQASIALDPYFEASYINLAELYRRQGDIAQEQMFYTNALRSLPDSALLHYSYALHLLRRKNHNDALSHTRRAVALAPLNTKFAYLHLLLLDTTGATREGLDWLLQHMPSFTGATQLRALGIKLAGKLGDTEARQRLLRTQNQ